MLLLERLVTKFSSSDMIVIVVALLTMSGAKPGPRQINRVKQRRRIVTMVRKAKLAALGPSKLTQVLAKLNAQPRLTLDTLRSLRLSYAFQNDHFGARYGVANS